VAWQRRPWWAYLIGGVVVVYLLSGMVVGVISAVREHGWLVGAGYAVLSAASLACGAVVLRRGGSTAGNLELLAVAAASGLAMGALAPYGGTGVLFFIIWVAPFRVRLWQAVLLAALVTGAFIAVSLVVGLPSGAIFGIAAGLGWAMFLAAVLNQLAVTRRQAAAVARARSSEAVLAERQRLAREIHDILAHSLSAQILHLEGARLLLERGEDVAKALDRVNRAGDLARAGLEETKRAVEALRGDQAPLADQLECLAEVFRAATGGACEVAISGDPARLAPEARLAIIRTAQEALTNAHKHAPGAEVTMALDCHGSWCELEVRDSGRDSDRTVATGSGYGLVGMRERAELIGGSLDAGPEGDGFRVRLRVPA
jgi:signal transduction histidine kinase